MSDTITPIQAVESAFEVASGTWQGARPWHDLVNGGRKISEGERDHRPPDQYVTDPEDPRFRQAYCDDSFDAGCDTCDQGRSDAADAEEFGERALGAARAGRWEEAERLAEQAEALEAGWGDSPTWGGVPAGGAGGVGGGGERNTA